MLDFAFAPEQDAFRETLRRFALPKPLPRYARGDRTDEYPREQIKRITAQIGDEADRCEDTLIYARIVAEEVARGDFNCVLPSLAPMVFHQFIAEARDELKVRWLPELRSGEQMIGLYLTEPDAGSDMGAMGTRAKRRGDFYVINGENNSVSYVNAHLFYVFARTDPTSSNWRGISGFLVPRDTAGLSFRAYEDMGCRSIPCGQLFLDDTEVPAENLVGSEGAAFQMICGYLDGNRAFVALKCLGAAQQTLDETVEYVKQRKQFGVPLATFQGVAFPIAEAATLLEAARRLSRKILWLRQYGQRCDREGAMARWWVPNIAAEIIHDCLLLHGHCGYTRDFPIEQWLRDVIGWQIGDGTPQIQKLIVARLIFGKEAELR